VTGGAGFIGSHLAAALVRRGDRVRVLDDLSAGSVDNLAGLEVGALGSGAGVELVRADIAGSVDLGPACAGVSTVFHEAAQVSVPQSFADPERCYAVNVLGTLRLLEACRANGVRRVVLAASSAAYGDSPTLPKVESMPVAPLSPYAASKVAGEHLMSVWGHAYGLRAVSLRYFNVFGPRQRDDSPYTGVIAIFARALLEGRRPTIYGDGEQTRDFTYVDNVVEANLAAAARDLPAGTVINVGGGEAISVNELFRSMAECVGARLAPMYAPARAGDVRSSLASMDRARALLAYVPRVGWRDGLARTIDWYAARMRPA